MSDVEQYNGCTDIDDVVLRKFEQHPLPPTIVEGMLSSRKRIFYNFLFFVVILVTVPILLSLLLIPLSAFKGVSLFLVVVVLGAVLMGSILHVPVIVKLTRSCDISRVVWKNDPVLAKQSLKLYLEQKDQLRAAIEKTKQSAQRKRRISLAVMCLCVVLMVLVSSWRGGGIGVGLLRFLFMVPAVAALSSFVVFVRESLIFSMNALKIDGMEKESMILRQKRAEIPGEDMLAGALSFELEGDRGALSMTEGREKQEVES